MTGLELEDTVCVGSCTAAPGLLASWAVTGAVIDDELAGTDPDVTPGIYPHNKNLETITLQIFSQILKVHYELSRVKW